MTISRSAPGWRALLVAQWACVAVVLARTSDTTSPRHKIHNLVLYPDRHSWCRTVGIQQVVTLPGCSTVQLPNHVCVGACFSYSIPTVQPSAPGETMRPYCDSCQPRHFSWSQVKLSCENDSGEGDTDGRIEVIKRVQLIHNCSCATCTSSSQQQSDRDIENRLPDSELDKADVPELMGLMMQTNGLDDEMKRHFDELEDLEQAQEPEERISGATISRLHTKITEFANLTDEADLEAEAEDAEKTNMTVDTDIREEDATTYAAEEVHNGRGGETELIGMAEVANHTDEVSEEEVVETTGKDVEVEVTDKDDSGKMTEVTDVTAVEYKPDAVDEIGMVDATEETKEVDRENADVAKDEESMKKAMEAIPLMVSPVVQLPPTEVISPPQLIYQQAHLQENHVDYTDHVTAHRHKNHHFGASRGASGHHAGS